MEEKKIYYTERKTVYEACDGMRFTSREDCMEYEKSWKVQVFNRLIETGTLKKLQLMPGNKDADAPLLKFDQTFNLFIMEMFCIYSCLDDGCDTVYRLKCDTEEQLLLIRQFVSCFEWNPKGTSNDATKEVEKRNREWSIYTKSADIKIGKTYLFAYNPMNEKTMTIDVEKAKRNVNSIIKMIAD